MRCKLNFGVFLRPFVQYLSSTAEAESVFFARGDADQTKRGATPTFLSRPRARSHPPSLPRGGGRRGCPGAVLICYRCTKAEPNTSFFVVVTAFGGWFVNLYKAIPPPLSGGSIILGFVKLSVSEHFLFFVLYYFM